MISLPDTIERCLAHDIKPGQFWDCAAFCERHQQISRDHRPVGNVVANACRHDTRLPARIPLGFMNSEDTQ